MPFSAQLPLPWVTNALDEVSRAEWNALHVVGTPTQPSSSRVFQLNQVLCHVFDLPLIKAKRALEGLAGLRLRSGSFVKPARTMFRRHTCSTASASHPNSHGTPPLDPLIDLLSPKTVVPHR